VSAKRLVEPGPDEAEVAAMFAMASAAPDHGRLTPWRFVVIPQSKRAHLAEAFALALIERDAGATLMQIESARDKAYRAPMLVLCVARLATGREPQIPDVERLVSLGCAIQNLLLAATSMGYGSGLASGQSISSARVRQLFRLGADEQAICFLHVGTVDEPGTARIRPSTDQIVSTL
jgi:nitroreductase